MSTSGRTEGPSTILGGLPVWLVVDSGKDPDTPNGPGDYWSQVVSIHWLKRDGTKGKEIPEHMRHRAEDYDYALCDALERHFDSLIAEEHANDATIQLL